MTHESQARADGIAHAIGMSTKYTRQQNAALWDAIEYLAEQIDRHRDNSDRYLDKCQPHIQTLRRESEQP